MNGLFLCINIFGVSITCFIIWIVLPIIAACILYTAIESDKKMDSLAKIFLLVGIITTLLPNLFKALAVHLFILGGALCVAFFSPTEEVWGRILWGMFIFILVGFGYMVKYYIPSTEMEHGY